MGLEVNERNKGKWNHFHLRTHELFYSKIKYGLESFDEGRTEIVPNDRYFSNFPVTQIVAHGLVVW